MLLITDKLLEPAPGSLRAKLEELREFAVSRLPKIRELLARPENVQDAHGELAECVGRLTLEATKENGKKRYLPHGKVDFFDEGDSHRQGWPFRCRARQILTLLGIARTTPQRAALSRSMAFSHDRVTCEERPLQETGAEAKEMEVCARFVL